MSFADYFVDAAIERGCGKRQAGGLYACTGVSPFGRPVEDFIIDPPILWDAGPFRGVRVRSRIVDTQDHRTEVDDLVMWVGAENYPFVPDFVEEGRMHGFCKRIPTGRLDEDGAKIEGPVTYERVRSHLSRMILVHPRAIALPEYIVHHESGLEIHRDVGCGACGPGTNTVRTHLTIRDTQIGAPHCTFACWDLSALQAVAGKHDVDSQTETWTAIRTPSVQYRVRTPERVDGQVPGDPPPVVDYVPGVFLALPLSHFEFVAPEGQKTVPPPIAEILGDNISHLAVCKE